MKKIIFFTAVVIIAGIVPSIAQHSDTLHPVADVYFKTNGGGEGQNTFMKFDISSIPPYSVVSNATLRVYVAMKSLSWDGDCKFMNVHSQTWQESDLEGTIWGFTRTDTIIQLLNFGISAPAWASSTDLKQIFLRDYNQSNSFCTMMLKDVDDPTMAPAGINPAIDSDDSLVVGDFLFTRYIIFPPHEFSNQDYIPEFIINYKIAPHITSQPDSLTLCYNAQATFSVTATGDSLKYQWQKNGSDISGATSSTYIINPATPADNGNYRCIVSNSVGADTSDIALLTVDPSLTADAGNAQTICLGNCITLGGSPSASGGTPPYTYLWSSNPPGFNSSIANPVVCPLVTSTFCVTVTDAIGCTASDCVTITVNPSPTANAGNDQTMCLGNCVAIGGAPTASGGTPPYSYSWAPSGSLDNPTIANPTACPAATTTFCVTVTDAVGCTVTDCVTITINTASAIAVANPSTICSGECSDISASGGGSYQWCCGLGSNASVIVCPDTTTTYYVTVTAPNGCTDVASTTVTVIKINNLTLSATDPTSCGSCDGSITANITGGAAPFIYQWSTVPVQNTQTATGLCAGMYCVTVTDANGCSATSCTSLNDPGPPIVDLVCSDADATICNGACITFTDTTAGIVNNVFYVNAVAVQTGASNSYTTCSLNDGDMVSVIGTDATGCSGSSNTFTMIVISVNVQITASADTICTGDCSDLTAIPSGGCPPYTYAWAPPFGTTQTINVCPTSTTTYTVTVVEGCSGCATVGSVTVVVETCTDILEYNSINIQFIPNPFSTSAQIISDKDFNDAELKVFDILGNQVEYMNNITGRTINIYRQKLAEGMYYYKISEKNIIISSGKFILN